MITRRGFLAGMGAAFGLSLIPKRVNSAVTPKDEVRYFMGFEFRRTQLKPLPKTAEYPKWVWDRPYDKATWIDFYDPIVDDDDPMIGKLMAGGQTQVLFWEQPRSREWRGISKPTYVIGYGGPFSFFSSVGKKRPLL